MIIIALLVLIFSPIFSIPIQIIGMIIDRRFSKIYLILFCISIATIGLYYHPIQSADGARVLSRLFVYESWSFADMINYHGFEKEPLSQLLFYYASQTGTPKVLFAISGFLTYFLTLYPVIDYCNKKNIKVTTRILAILLILSYNVIVSNLGAVRYPLGYSVVIFSWYIIYMRNMKITGFILSVFAFLLHNSFLAHFVILIISHFTYGITKSKFSYYILFIFLISWGFFSSQVIEVIGFLFENSMVNSVGDKLEIYVSRGYSNYWYVILGISGGVVTLFTLNILLSKRNNILKNSTISESKYFYLIINYFVFVIGSALFANIFVRFLIVAVMLSAIPLIMQNSKSTYRTFVFNIIIFFAIITGFVYQMSMDLSVENGWASILFKNVFSLWLSKLI